MLPADLLLNDTSMATKCSHLQVITVMIQSFEAGLSPCQSKGWYRLVNWSFNSRYHRAVLTEWWSDCCCHPPKVSHWPLSCPGCHTSQTCTRNKDVFCSQGHTLCNGILVIGPKDPKKNFHFKSIFLVLNSHTLKAVCFNWSSGLKP